MQSEVGRVLIVTKMEVGFEIMAYGGKNRSCTCPLPRWSWDL